MWNVSFWSIARRWSCFAACAAALLLGAASAQACSIDGNPKHHGGECSDDFTKMPALRGTVTQPLSCPSGYYASGGACEPISKWKGDCPSGMVFSGGTCLAFTPVCPANTEWTGNQCTPIDPTARPAWCVADLGYLWGKNLAGAYVCYTPSNTDYGGNGRD